MIAALPFMVNLQSLVLKPVSLPREQSLNLGCAIRTAFTDSFTSLRTLCLQLSQPSVLVDFAFDTIPPLPRLDEIQFSLSGSYHFATSNAPLDEQSLLGTMRFFGSHAKTLSSLTLDFRVSVDFSKSCVALGHLERLGTFSLCTVVGVEAKHLPGVEQFVARHCGTLKCLELRTVRESQDPLLMTMFTLSHSNGQRFDSLTILKLGILVHPSADFFEVIRGRLRQLIILRVSRTTFDERDLKNFYSILRDFGGKPSLQRLELSIYPRAADINQLSEAVAFLPFLEVLQVSLDDWQLDEDFIEPVSGDAPKPRYILHNLN